MTKAMNPTKEQVRECCDECWEVDRNVTIEGFCTDPTCSCHAQSAEAVLKAVKPTKEQELTSEDIRMAKEILDASEPKTVPALMYGEVKSIPNPRLSEAVERMKTHDYERISHSHCWNQKDPACGIPLKDHKQCCLCPELPPEALGGGLESQDWEENMRQRVRDDYGEILSPELVERTADWWVNSTKDVISKALQAHEKEVLEWVLNIRPTREWLTKVQNRLQSLAPTP